MKIVNCAAITVLSLIFFSCRRQPELHVFNWTDYIGKNTISSFESSADAEVTYDNYSSNEDLIAKLEAGGAHYDVIFPSAYAVEILRSKGLLSKLDHGKIANLEHVMEQFRSPAVDPTLENCVPYTWSTTGIGFNSSRITEEAARNWQVLFDPKYQDKILMLDDVRASMGMALRSLGFSANTSSSSEIDKARQLLIEQKPLVHVYTNSNIPQLLASGEVDLVYGWSGDILQASQKNEHIRYRIPDGGSLVYVDFMCVPRSARNRDLALAFINHVLEPEVSVDIAQTIRYPTTNQGAYEKADEETRKLWDILGGARDLSRFESVKNLGETVELYDRAWQEIKTASSN